MISNAGCRNQTISRQHELHQPVKVNISGKYSNTGLTTSVGQFSSLIQVITDEATTGAKATDYMSTERLTSVRVKYDQMSTSHSTTERVTLRLSTNEGVIILNTLTDHVTTRHSITDQVSSSHATIAQLATDLPKSTQVASGLSTTNGVTIDNAVTEQVTTSLLISNRVITGHSTSEQQSPHHDITNQVSTDRVTWSSLPTKGGTSVDMESNQEIPAQSETTQTSVSTQLCPQNMIYAYCSMCQSTCSDPNSCISNCDEAEACVCGNGYFLKGDDCVTQEECGCYIEGYGVLQEGGLHVTSDCTLQCNCSGGKLECDNEYRCSSNAVCESRDNARKCYCNSGYTGDGVACTSTYIATDCYDVFIDGNTESGVYNIKPTTWSGPPFEVFCNMADGGGWTRRVDGTVNFDLYWNDFKDGFGSPGFEHWLGNEKIYSLTNQKDYQLQIDFVNIHRNPYYAKYDSFRIDNEANNYRITVGIYSEGNAGDSLKVSQNNEEFSTRDRDNDDYLTGNIAATPAFGAWWYGNEVYSSDLNAHYVSGNLYWKTLPGNENYIRFTEMKVRPI
ncbi:Fibrinogen C domain-containing protein 1 [Holothuria leucospilota]|uniref:Fibrinogen C domain-containing protein 1 n=1 Tax=Holothuria leucospilota TaxID=206669 RepID=A0A9Q1H369_HOLLE|nr:Fibrinogen C domain-containing protein 1 [Holothuria leucospilota]